jgi:hypothetical protein
MVRRRLLLLLVLGLVPVLIVATPGVANAATVAGTAQQFAWDLSEDWPEWDPVPGMSGQDEVSCQGSGRWMTGQGIGPGTPPPIYSIEWNVACASGGNISSIELRSLVANGFGCSMNWSQEPGAELDGTDGAAGTMTGSPSETCNITELCVLMDVSHHSALSIGDNEVYFCIDWPLGMPPDPPEPEEPPEGACPYGFPNQALATLPLLTGQTSIYQRLILLGFTGRDETVSWVYTARSGATGGTQWLADRTLPLSPTYAGSWNAEGKWQTTTGPTTGSTVMPVGVDIRAKVVVGGNAQVPAGMVQTQPIGMTSPENCVFWMGDRILDTPGTDDDDPWGPMGDPLPPEEPDPEPEPLPDPVPPEPPASTCDFSWTDPTTWATGGICEIVRRLGALIDTVWRLPGRIWDAMKDGLAALFIPGAGFVQGKVDAMRDAWADTPPLVLVESVQTVGDAVQLASPGSGCSGPALSFNTPLTGPTTLHPMSSCSESVSQVATVVKAGLTVVVWVGGILAALRVTAAAFGLQLSFGRGDEA